MKLFTFLAAFLIFFSVSKSAMAQRFTTKNQPPKAEASEAKDSVHTKNQNAEKAYAALKAGRLVDARKLLAAVPVSAASDPFAMYVRASLNENAVEAAGIYKEIVAENSSKPIGHDALLQLYKYHFAAGNYKSAHTDYVELLKYPDATTDELIDPAGLKDSIQTPQGFDVSQRHHGESDIESCGEFIVQVGLFSTRENARKFVDELRSKNIDAAIFAKTEDEKTLYAVSAGSFSTRDAAEAFASDLKNRSINCMVVSPQSEIPLGQK